MGEALHASSLGTTNYTDADRTLLMQVLWDNGRTAERGLVLQISHLQKKAGGNGNSCKDWFMIFT